MFVDTCRLWLKWDNNTRHFTWGLNVYLYLTVIGLCIWVWTCSPRGTSWRSEFKNRGWSSVHLTILGMLIMIGCRYVAKMWGGLAARVVWSAEGHISDICTLFWQIITNLASSDNKRVDKDCWDMLLWSNFLTLIPQRVLIMLISVACRILWSSTVIPRLTSDPANEFFG